MEKIFLLWLSNERVFCSRRPFDLITAAGSRTAQCCLPISLTDNKKGPIVNERRQFYRQMKIACFPSMKF